MTINLDELEATARAATPGPWWHQPYGDQNQNGDYFGGDIFDSTGEYLISEVRDEDGEHIAAFDPLTVLALIAELRQARECIEKVQALEPMWPRGMYGCPQDMFGRAQIAGALATYDQEGAS